MEYLCEKNILHRDLAARNVLVTKEDHMKITDFGLARVMPGEKNYYKLTPSKECPVYWSVWVPQFLSPTMPKAPGWEILKRPLPRPSVQSCTCHGVCCIVFDIDGMFFEIFLWIFVILKNAPSLTVSSLYSRRRQWKWFHQIVDRDSGNGFTR